MALRHVTRDTLAILNRARVLCPVRTGNLRNGHNWQIRVDGMTVRGEVFNKVRYAGPVHNGRGARVIRVKRARALRFFWRGRLWYRRSVRQPATRGKPWLHDALEEIAVLRGYKLTRDPRYTYPSAI